MEDILKQEGFWKITIKTNLEQNIVYINQGGDDTICVKSKHLFLFISKLAKFVDGDDRSQLMDELYLWSEGNKKSMDEILKDYIIIKRPTDETGK